MTGRGIDIGPLGFAVHALVTVLAIGLLSGFFQRLILRQQVNRAGRWVWVTTGGIALGMLAAVALLLGPVGAVGWLRPEDFPSAGSRGIAGAMVGLVYGAVAGQELLRLRQLSATDRVSEG